MSALASQTREIFPPKVEPSKWARHFPQMPIILLLNNLAAIPREVYDQELVVLPGPPRIAYCVGEEILEFIMKTNHTDFTHAQVMRDTLGPLIGNALPLTEREDWTWLRRVMAPFFQPNAMKIHVASMNGAAKRMIERWHNAPSLDYRDIFHDMLETAYDATALIAVADGGKPLRDAFLLGREDYFKGANWRILFSALGLPKFVPRPSEHFMLEYESGVRSALLKLVKERRKKVDKGNDLLAHMIKINDAETGEPVSDELVVDNLTSIMIGSFDTIALTISWALYLLSSNPKWLQKALAEIKTVAAAGDISVEQVDQLVVIQQILNETMRLYPSTPQMVRNIEEDIVYKGKRIKAGTLGAIPIYAIHRHRKLWQDPDAFNPDRFSKDAKLTKYQFFPFGAGPRICIGKVWSMTEMTIFLATFLREAQFSNCTGFAPQPIGKIFLLSKNGMRLNVKVRDKHCC